MPQALSFPEVEAEGGVWVATYAPDLHSGVAKIIAKDTLSAAIADKRIQFPEVLRNGGGAATEIGPVAARISTKDLPEMRKEGWIVALTDLTLSGGMAMHFSKFDPFPNHNVAQLQTMVDAFNESFLPVPMVELIIATDVGQYTRLGTQRDGKTLSITCSHEELGEIVKYAIGIGVKADLWSWNEDLEVSGQLTTLETKSIGTPRATSGMRRVAPREVARQERSIRGEKQKGLGCGSRQVPGG